MSFAANCPSCHVRMRFPPDAAGASVECPKCHNFFTAAPTDEAPLPERFRRLPARAAKAAIAEAIPASDTAGHTPRSDDIAQAAPAVPGTPETPASFTRRPVNLAGIAAFLCGSVGLLCASIASLDFLTIPLTGLGLLLGGAGLLLEDTRRKGVLLAVLGVVVCLPVLVLAVFWPHHLTDSFGRSRPQALPDSNKPLVIRSRGDHIQEPPRPAGAEPVPAELGGIRLGNVQVRVLRTVLGTVELSGRPEKPLPPEKNLSITLRVANVGTKDRVKYGSWGAALRTRTANAPRLRDSLGTSYELRDFGPGVIVPGRFRGKELLPGKFVNDRLVFPEPADSADYFLLELPAAAVGGEGAFKFKILRSHVVRDGSAAAPGL